MEGEGRDSELTIRAVLCGCVIGAVLAAGNVYMALQTGFADPGFVVAAVLGFVTFRFAQQLGARHYSILENNITQTVASSAGSMVFTAGLVSVVPALTMLSIDFPPWAFAAWGFCLALVGIGIGTILRQQVIVEDKLPFPSGAATAADMQALHSTRDGIRRAYTLLGSGAGAMALVWFRDGRPAFVPPFVSPMLIGGGMLIGLRAGLSMFVGAVFAQVALPGFLKSQSFVADNPDAVANWLLWPGVTMMVAAGMVALLAGWRLFASAFRDVGNAMSASGSKGGALAFVIFVGLALVLLGWQVFGVPIPLMLASLILSIIFAIVAARVTGETDIAPSTQMGQASQTVFAVTVPAQAAQGMLGSLVAAGAAAHTAGQLWALRAGQEISASPKRQAIASVIGALVGAAVSVPVYFLLARVYGIANLPAPSAKVSKTIFDFAAAGTAAIPPGALVASLLAVVFATGLTLGERTRVGKYLPSAVAVSIGFILPIPFCALLFLGSLIGFIWLRASPAGWDEHGVALASGGIAGEALMGVLIAVLHAIGAF